MRRIANLIRFDQPPESALSAGATPLERWRDSRLTRYRDSL